MPDIILASEFRTPGSGQRYGEYVDYVLRREALMQKEFSWASFSVPALSLLYLFNHPLLGGSFFGLGVVHLDA